VNYIDLTAWILVMIITAFAMEGVAYALHKYVMHGIGWYFHESHHRPPGSKKGLLEKNDVYSIGFAVVAIILIFKGITNFNEPYFWIGMGLTLYGAGYAIFHDVIFHQRIRVKRPKSIRYLNRIIAAHEIHHRYSRGKKGYSFGFLYASKFYSQPDIVKNFGDYLKNKEVRKDDVGVKHKTD
jgi:beta-carotene 3-hydroxylase